LVTEQSVSHGIESDQSLNSAMLISAPSCRPTSVASSPQLTPGTSVTSMIV